MTTSPPALGTTSEAPVPVLSFAVAGAVVAALATAVGTFADLAGNSNNDYGIREYGFDLAIIALSTALVFRFVLRTAHQGNAARRALVLGALSIPAVLVFPTGLPYVLAAGALACAAVARRAGTSPGYANVAAALATVSIAASLFFAVTG